MDLGVKLRSIPVLSSRSAASPVAYRLHQDLLEGEAPFHICRQSNETDCLPPTPQFRANLNRINAAAAQLQVNRHGEDAFILEIYADRRAFVPGFYVRAQYRDIASSQSAGKWVPRNLFKELAVRAGYSLQPHQQEASSVAIEQSANSVYTPEYVAAD